SLVIAMATSRMFSSRLFAVTTTRSSSVAPGPAVPADSASWARALPVAESTMAVPMARASRERRERPVIVDAVMVSLPGILIRDHDPNQRIVNTYGKYRPAAGSACRRDSAWFVHGSGCRSEEHTSELQSR